MDLFPITNTKQEEMNYYHLSVIHNLLREEHFEQACFLAVKQ